MLENGKIPTKKECEDYFEAKGVCRERGAEYWEHENRYHWKSRFPIQEQLTRWIENTPVHQRLKPIQKEETAGRGETVTQQETAKAEAPKRLKNAAEWAAEIKAEQARREKERFEREGELIGMPADFKWRRHSVVQ